MINRPVDGQINIEAEESRFSTTFLNDLVEHHRKKVVPKYKKFQNIYEGKTKIFKKKVEENKPCNKISNDFCGQIIDDTVGYFLGNPIAVSYRDTAIKAELQTAEADVGVDLTEVKDCSNIQEEIDGIFMDNYKDDLFMEWGKEAMIKSLSHLLVYQDEESATRIIKLSPEDVIVVYENSSIKKAKYKIRLYTISTEDTDVTTTYAEVYSATKMELFKMVEDSSVPNRLDTGFEFVEERAHIYGKIPIVTLYNNEEELSDLEKIESLVNDYNRVMSDISDEFEAFRNAYLVIKDMVMSGDSLQKLKEEGIVEVTDSGDMRFVTKEIQTEAINSHLDRLAKNIHKFAQVPDLSDENFAGNLSGVAIRFKLFGLETKCITKERKMEKAIRQLLEILAVPVQVITGEKINLRYIKVEFTRNIPNNITELVDTVCKLDGKVDKETLLMLLPFIDNPKEVLEKLKIDAKENQKANDPYAQANIEADGAMPFPNLNNQTEAINSIGRYRE